MVWQTRGEGSSKQVRVSPGCVWCRVKYATALECASVTVRDRRGVGVACEHCARGRAKDTSRCVKGDIAFAWLCTWRGWDILWQMEWCVCVCVWVSGHLCTRNGQCMSVTACKIRCMSLSGDHDGAGAFLRGRMSDYTCVYTREKRDCSLCMTGSGWICDCGGSVFLCVSWQGEDVNVLCGCDRSGVYLIVWYMCMYDHLCVWHVSIYFCHYVWQALCMFVGWVVFWVGSLVWCLLFLF